MNEWSPEVIKEDQSEKVKCPIPDDISREPRRKKKRKRKKDLAFYSDSYKYILFTK